MAEDDVPMSRTLWIAAFLLAMPAFASAQNALTPGALELRPNLEAVGVRVAYTGDADLDASGHLEWRPAGAPTWSRGTELVRIAGSRFAASVFWLAPGTRVDVRAVLSDPDGGGGTVEGSVVTRTIPVSVATGRTWWVAANGRDGAAGTGVDPLRSIQAAADLAQPGDEVRVRAGVYEQTLDTPRPGTAASPIHLVADAPGVVLEGSDPAMRRRTDWRDDGGGVFSVPFTGATRLVCADSLQRLHRKATLADLRANTDGVAQGWTIEAGRLWVKLEDGSNPAGHVMHVARFDVGILVDESDWRVTGFEVRHYGLTSAASGIQLRAASRCLVNGNHVHTIGGKNIWLRALAADNVIESNLCRDPRIGTWPWQATKAHEEEQQGIAMRGGRGNVLRANVIDGTFDGIDVAGGGTDENEGADTDVNHNRITGTADDAVEPEGMAGINVRVWRNTIDRVYSGISIAPNSQGPTYVFFNTFTNSVRGAFKFSLSSTGQNFIWHNTAVAFGSGIPAVHPSGPYSNVHFRNNILVGSVAAAVSDDAGESVSGCSYDGDLLSSNYPALFRWQGVNYASLAALRTATGFETAGTQGAPVFVNASAGDWRLVLGSPGVDAALRLPGMNDGFLGAAPDCGAFETAPTASVDATPPARVNDLEAR